jgi:hypothetical protein
LEEQCSEPVTVMGGPPAIFRADFAGGLAKGNHAVGVAVDATRGDDSGRPSARVRATGDEHYLITGLGGTYGSVCASASVRLAAGSGSVSLIRLRTAGNVGIGRVYVNLDTDELWLRSDVRASTRRSNATMSRSRWHHLELCATSGTSASHELSLDGTRILSWNANNGPNPIWMVQLGDSSSQTYPANFDDVVVVEP